jgi:hypothetical protein
VSDSATQASRECPSCGYELRGLTSDHCPECGAIVAATAELKRLETLVQVGVGRRCAVCGADVHDAEAKRCPVCHSRYVRGGAGGGGGAAGSSIGVLPAPEGPPRREESKPHKNHEHDVWAVTLVLAGMVLLAGAAGLAGFRHQDIAGFPAIVGIVLIGWGVWRGMRMPEALKLARMRQCVGCGYPIPEDHHGRCPECGKLVMDLPPEERFCPGCRRSLRGFRGDSCPECAADVRTICEGIDEAPPAEAAGADRPV